MNFEIKSTFKYTSWLLRIGRHMDHAVYLLIVILTACAVMWTLYVHNYIIPATIGSRPHGELYIRFIEDMGYLTLLAISYCIQRIIRVYCGKYITRMFYFVGGEHLQKFTLYLQNQLISVYLVLNLLHRPPRLSMALQRSEKYHNGWHIQRSYLRSISFIQTLHLYN